MASTSQTGHTHHPCRASCPSFLLLSSTESRTKRHRMTQCQPGGATASPAPGHGESGDLNVPGLEAQSGSLDFCTSHGLTSSRPTASAPSLNPRFKHSFTAFTLQRVKLIFPESVAVPCGQAQLPWQPSCPSLHWLLPSTTRALTPLHSTPTGIPHFPLLHLLLFPQVPL